MIIGLRAGHSPNCKGAIGIVDEHEQMKIYFTYVKNLFEQYGHTVIDCNSNAYSENVELSEGAKKCNDAGCDLFISLHMNSFNGKAYGYEALVSSTGSSAYPYAVNLANNFASLGFFNRGVKFAHDFEMNHIKCGNIINEICFCDSPDDIKIYNQYSWDELAHTLCNAIDSNIPKTPKKRKCFIQTNYLLQAYDGYKGVNISEINRIKDEYFAGINTYIVPNDKGIWIETQYLSENQCEELKNKLGDLFYAIKYEE